MNSGNTAAKTEHLNRRRVRTSETPTCPNSEGDHPNEGRNVDASEHPTVLDDHDIDVLDTPDWRSRNAELRHRYLTMQSERDAAIERDDHDAAADATRSLDQLGREFYELNQGLALASARRFGTGAGSLADYQAAAALGLWEAFTRWDPDRGVAFSTFSRQYVNGRIQRSVRQVEFSQLSQSEFALRKHVRIAANAIAGAERRAATVEELAEAVGDKPERVLRTMAAPNASLETPLGDGSSTLGDLIADEKPALADIDNVDDLAELLDTLPDLEAWILASRSGAYGGKTPSLLDIAGHLGIGREIARRAETRGRLTLAAAKLERENPSESSVDTLAELTGKSPKHVRKHLLEPDLNELRWRWARTCDALALSGDRSQTRTNRSKLGDIGRETLRQISPDAHDAAGRYTTSDGESITADEAACVLFDAFLQWDPESTTWKAQARNHLNAVGKRTRRQHTPEPVDQDNTWSWLETRHVPHA